MAYRILLLEISQVIFAVWAAKLATVITYEEDTYLSIELSGSDETCDAALEEVNGTKDTIENNTDDNSLDKDENELVSSLILEHHRRQILHCY